MEQDQVRTLLVAGASRARIVVAIAKRCRLAHTQWHSATIAQVMHVLDVDILTAEALVSEYIAVGNLSGDWKTIIGK